MAIVGMKYIIYENDMGMEVPLIFSTFQEHAKIANQMGVKPVAAGFLVIIDNQFQTYGKSVSLGVSSREGQDAALINRVFGTER